MPPVLIALGGILTFGAATGAAALAVGAAFVINMAILGVTMLISYLTRPGAQTVTIQAVSRQPVSYRRVIYGSVRASGVMTYIGVSGANNEALHMVITLAGHQVYNIGTTYIEGFAGHNDSNTTIEGTSYPIYQLEIDKGNPATTSQPFPLLAAAIPSWDSTCLQRGNAKVHIAFKYDVNVWPNGAPSSIAFDVLGKLIYDPRSSSTTYSDNAALVVRDWLTDVKYGMGASASQIDDIYTIAAANICDQSVAVNASNVATIGTCTSVNVTSGLCAITATNNLKVGTEISLSGFTYATFLNGLTGVYVTAVSPTAFYFSISQSNFAHSSETGTATAPSTQNRYRCDGVVDCGMARGDVLRGLLSSMVGYCIQPGDAWRIIAGAYVTPTIILTEDDLRGAIKMDTLVSMRDLANSINGTFISPANNWQGSSFPSYQDATALAADGNQPIWQNIALNFTTDGICAQRLAKIYLERIRRQKSLVLPCKLSAFPLQPGDTVMFTFPLFGFNQKVFEVQQTSIVLDSAASPIRFGVAQPGQGNDMTSGNPSYTAQTPCVGVDLVLRELDANVFAWNPATDENTWLGPRQTTVPTPTTCQPPTGVTAISGAGEAMVRADGLITDRILVQWTSPTDEFVLNGGSIEIYAQPITSPPTGFSLQGTAAGSDTQFYILNCVDGQAYNVLVYAVNVAGVNSAGVEVTNITASGGTTTFGGNISTVPASQIAALTTLAPYSGSTAYTPGMEVTYTGNMYKCILATTGNVPTNATYWVLVGPQTLDNVINGPTYGKINNTSIANGVPYVFTGAWSSATSYIVGNEVSYNGNYWLCIVNNSNSAPTTLNSNWQIEGPVNLGNVQDGSSNFSATASVLTYRPTTNPLTGHDAGSNTTINIASFTMRTSSKGDIPISSGSVVSLSYNTLYYVYYDDPTLAGGAVSYSVTTTKATAINGTGRFFVGSVLTPKAAAPDTVGANDGGVGAQLGGTSIVLFSQVTGGGNSAIDGDVTTFTSISPATSQTTYDTMTVSLPMSMYYTNLTSLTLSVRTSITGAISPSDAKCTYSINGGAAVTIWSTSGGANRALQTDTVTLSLPVNIATISVSFSVRDTSGFGNITGNFYEAWLTLIN